MIRIYLPHSGNLGDTLNALPLLDLIYRTYNEGIHIIVKPKMRMFNGIEELFLLQHCIHSFNFSDDDVSITDGVYILPLCDEKDTFKIDGIPHETMRYYINAKKVFNIKDPLLSMIQFELNIPNGSSNDLELVGDRTFHPMGDSRRKFDILKDIFSDDRYTFLDYSKSVVDNAKLIKESSRPFHTTFTGIAIMANLMCKETYIYYDETLEKWNGRNTIYDSFDQHFFRYRNCYLTKI